MAKLHNRILSALLTIYCFAGCAKVPASESFTPGLYESADGQLILLRGSGEAEVAMDGFSSKTEVCKYKLEDNSKLQIAVPINGHPVDQTYTITRNGLVDADGVELILGDSTRFGNRLRERELEHRVKENMLSVAIAAFNFEVDRSQKLSRGDSPPTQEELDGVHYPRTETELIKALGQDWLINPFNHSRQRPTFFPNVDSPSHFRAPTLGLHDGTIPHSGGVKVQSPLSAPPGDPAAIAELEPFNLPPGQIQYFSIKNGATFAITGGGAVGRALPGIKSGTTFVLVPGKSGLETFGTNPDSNEPGDKERFFVAVKELPDGHVFQEGDVACLNWHQKRDHAYHRLRDFIGKEAYHVKTNQVLSEENIKNPDGSFYCKVLFPDPNKLSKTVSVTALTETVQPYYFVCAENSHHVEIDADKVPPDAALSTIDFCSLWDQPRDKGSVVLALRKKLYGDANVWSSIRASHDLKAGQQLTWRDLYQPPDVKEHPPDGDSDSMLDDFDDVNHLYLKTDVSKNGWFTPDSIDWSRIPTVVAAHDIAEGQKLTAQLLEVKELKEPGRVWHSVAQFCSIGTSRANKLIKAGSAIVSSDLDFDH